MEKGVDVTGSTVGAGSDVKLGVGEGCDVGAGFGPEDVARAGDDVAGVEELETGSSLCGGRRRGQSGR